MSNMRLLPSEKLKGTRTKNPPKSMSNLDRKPSLHKISSRSRSKINKKTEISVRSDQISPLSFQASLTNFNFQALTSIPTPKTPEQSNYSETYTPNQVFNTFKSSLSQHEQMEIFDYPEIFYFGTNAEKIDSNEEDNWGYDNYHGEYKIVTGDHLMYRYEIFSVIGQGAFGTVCRCLDHKTGEHLAIKILLNRKKFHEEGGMEVKILNLLNETDKENGAHIVRFITHFEFRNHLCLVFELLSLNLYDFLVLSNYEGFDITFIRRVSIQLLLALRHIKMNNVIHADLKPENIMLEKQHRSSIKLIDYGSSCLQHEIVYSYIESRFYRAPEIILGVPYTSSIDMWSLGCVLVELYTGYPLFPAENELTLLAMMIQVLGLPNTSFLFRAPRMKKYFNLNGTSKLSVRKIKTMVEPLNKIINENFPEFLSFLESILVWDPEERLSPDEALRHPWIFEEIEEPPRPTRSFKRYRKHKSSAVAKQKK